MSVLEENYSHPNIYFDKVLSIFRSVKFLFEPRLIMLSGYMSNSERVLPTGKLKIGSHSNNDLILIDDQIKDTALEIDHIRTFIFSTVRISAINNKVLVNEGKSLLQGNSSVKSLPVTLQIEGVKIKIQEPSVFSKRSKNILFSSIFVGLFAFFTVYTFINNNIADAYSNPKIFTSLGIKKNNQENKLTHKSDFEELGEKIFESGLKLNVSPPAASDGQVHISGVVPSNMIDEWRSINRWIDEAGAGSKVTKSVTIEPILSYENLIAGISTSNGEKRIILEDGRILQKGDELVYGWKVTEIANSLIHITKADITYELSLKGVGK